MNAVTLQSKLGPVSAVAARYAQSAPVQDELGAGITAGFAVMSYRGKVWRIKSGGEERDLVNPETGDPLSSVELVIVKASPVLSKIFYLDGYTDGSSAAPDCFSTNGVTPDAASPKKQCNTCAACPHNAFGSAKLANGQPGKGKACHDSKRLAVVPLGDIDNEPNGGPMLLRVPAGSFKELTKYADAMKSQGFPFFAVGTRIGFDMKEAFPKLVFRPIRALDDDEAAKVVALRDDPSVARVLAEGAELAQDPAVAAVLREAAEDSYQFEQPPQPAPKPAQAAHPAPAAPKAAPQPVAAPAEPEDAEYEEVAAPAPQPAPKAAATKPATKPAPAPKAAAKPAPQPAPVPEPVAEVAEAAGGGDAPASFDDMLDSLIG